MIGQSSRGLHKLRVALLAALSMLMWTAAARAHEISPAVIDIRVAEGQVQLEMSVSIEAFLAEIALDQVTDTKEAANSEAYDALRSLDPAGLEARLREGWTSIAPSMTLIIQDNPVALSLLGAAIPAIGDPELERVSVLTVSAEIPPGAETFRFGWAAKYGEMILREADLEGGFVDYVSVGAMSPDLSLRGQAPKTGWQSFVTFIPVGFDHIVPKGLDHILFVMGLFLLSTRLRPLLWQVTSFTAAHTVTLGLASLGVIAVNPAVVEPLIAISIVYVAVENILAKDMMRWRPVLVFAFGLLHGMGFATVLGEFGLPEQGFIPALLGFNVGVELGQICVILICFAAFGFWFGSKPWYRARISVPLSVLIAAVGAYWAVERMFL